MTTTQYTVKQIETEGVKCDFFSLGANRDGWIMPDGTGVIYAGYAQVCCEPETISTSDAEGLRRARHAVANARFHSFEFGWGIVDTDGWSGIESDDWTKICYAEDGEDSARLVLHVRFKEGGAEPCEVYALDLASGDVIAGTRA